MNTKTYRIVTILSMVMGFAAFSPASANDLNLRTGSAEVMDANAVSLQNLSLGEQRYNAVIQLNLDGSYQVLSAELAQADENAQYEVIFISDWSVETHPYQYPSGQSHFAGLIGATHQSHYRLWTTGETATPGIEQMAETGAKSILSAEIESAIGNGDAEFVLSGGGIGASPGSVSLTFEITADYPFVSLVSMIAPSPDWFVGVSGLSLIQDGQWLDELVLSLFAYDAGTDDGESYISPNSDTNPQSTITLLRELPFVEENDRRPLGRFIFRRIRP